MVREESQIEIYVEEKDVGMILPSMAIERMARFFLMRMNEAERKARTFVNSGENGYA